jgi:ribose transport system substrate-binding protein
MRLQRMMILLLTVLFLAGVIIAFYLQLFHITTVEEKKIIAVLKTSDVHSDFWQTVSAGAKAAAKELSIKIDVQGPLQEADVNTQIHLLEEAIKQKPQAIILAPTDSQKLAPIAKKIQEAGIRLVVIDTPLSGNLSPNFVSNNNIEAGIQAGITAATETNGNPVVAILKDSPDADTFSEREQGIQQSLFKYKNSIAGTFYTEGSEERAYNIITTLVAVHPEVNAIITLNEPATLGAAKAIKEKKKVNDIKLIGFDSSIYAIKLMEEGILNAVIVQKPFNIGYTGVKNALQLIDGKKISRITYIDSIVVMKSNMYSPENQKLLFPFIEK